MIRKSISFPPELHAQLIQLAKENNRSFTKQVVWMLSQSIGQKLLVIVKDDLTKEQVEENLEKGR